MRTMSPRSKRGGSARSVLAAAFSGGPAGASRASRPAAFVVVRTAAGGFDSHTLVREASIRGAISATRARSTMGRVILTRPILRLKE